MCTSPEWKHLVPKMGGEGWRKTEKMEGDSHVRPSEQSGAIRTLPCLHIKPFFLTRMPCSHINVRPLSFKASLVAPEAVSSDPAAVSPVTFGAAQSPASALETHAFLSSSTTRSLSTAPEKQKGTKSPDRPKKKSSIASQAQGQPTPDTMQQLCSAARMCGNGYEMGSGSIAAGTRWQASALATAE